ncbi:MAG: phage holin family protein [Flaviaesturariibacter sp.]|nr:phage holin family protein [Flaviaesturariibacter sp.]
MRIIIKLLITVLAALAASYFLEGVQIADFQIAIIVAIVLSLLNTFIKPILVAITLPFTLLTLGLFLLVINAIIVKLADYFIDGFSVHGWITAILFSLIVTVVSFLLDKLLLRRD